MEFFILTVIFEIVSLVLESLIIPDKVNLFFLEFKVCFPINYNRKNEMYKKIK